MQYHLRLCGSFGAIEKAQGLTLYGKVYYQESSLTAQSLLPLLEAAIASDALTQLLNELQGFYALIWEYQQQLYLVTDKVRSRPLFYAVHNQQLIVSDVVDQISKHLTLPASFAELSNLAQQEFTHTGFVTGRETLHPNIKQVQAGELVIADLKNSQLGYQRYYCYMLSNRLVSNDKPTPTPTDLDQVVRQVTMRLIEYAAGRQIVVPLSGGYDSRALALMLKRCGYTNVLCFTFGRRGSAEVKLSRQIAHDLGFAWHCVYYSRAMWHKLQASPVFADYLRFVHNNVSVPNIQVFPAIKTLVEQGVVAKNAVVAPGHTAAFFSGDPNVDGKVPENEVVQRALTVVVNLHYQNNRAPLNAALLDKVLQQLTELADYAVKRGIVNFNSVSEAWNYQERQAKFIINSNRYYDYFQLDWWMPFWDDRFMVFWQQAPYALRQRKQFWISYVNTSMQAYTGNTTPYGHASVKKYRWLTRCYSWFNYFLDDNHLFALVPFKRWCLFKLRLSARSGTVFGCLAEYCLQVIPKTKQAEKDAFSRD